MTIPITLIVPWIIFAAIAAFLGIFAHMGARYPKDPTLIGWLVWVAVFYSIQALAYATWRGWVHWS